MYVKKVGQVDQNGNKSNFSKKIIQKKKFCKYFWLWQKKYLMYANYEKVWHWDASHNQKTKTKKIK